MNKNEISFSTSETLDSNQEIIIDPWISNLTSLTTFNAGQDIEFDNSGNLLVYGGGGPTNTNNPKVAKYDINGNLLWTFMGFIPSINWVSNPDYSFDNFVVDKNNNKIYIGQGYNYVNGSQIIRLKSNGVYDHFKTLQNNLFKEVWEMKINCATGDLIAMGGCTASNLNFSIIDTNNGYQNISNVTGITATFFQDIANAVIDENGEVYTIFASNYTPLANNYIYKLNSNYNTVLWNSPTGYSVLSEATNNPYYLYYIQDGINGLNCLSVNDSLLFYYDGFNLKAFNRNSGVPVGTPITIPQKPKFQAGIYANNCNEIFIGDSTGGVLKYYFNGSTFSPLSSIVISGQAGHKIHDIVYNPINNNLYVCGDSFVAVIQTNSACLPMTSNNISISSSHICPNVDIVSINNPLSLSYTFQWQDTITGNIIQMHKKPIGTYSDTLYNITNNSVYKVTVIEPSSCQILDNFIYVTGVCNGSSAFLCPGETYTLSNGSLVSNTGVYQDTLVNVYGLDSIINVNIVNVAITYTNNATICEGENYFLPNGSFVSAIGTYTNTFLNRKGCDSIIITNLVQLKKDTSYYTRYMCFKERDTLKNGTIIFGSNYPGHKYQIYYTNIKGCDSVVLYNAILYPYAFEVNQVFICPPASNYILPNGLSVSTDEVDTVHFATLNGCDSFALYSIHFVTNSLSTINKFICPNSTYTLPNGTIVSSIGTYTNVFINSNGCDSTIIINLLNGGDIITKKDSICNNSTYQLPNGNIVSSAGSYTNTFLNTKNCDSTIITNLSIISIPTTIINAAICKGFSYTLPKGNVVKIAGAYKDTLLSILGCDSIIITNLIVYPSPTYSLSNDTTICTVGSIINLFANSTSNITWSSSSGVIACPACNNITVSPTIV